LSSFSIILLDSAVNSVIHEAKEALWGRRGRVWYHWWEVPGCFFGFYLREAEKILYNKSR